MGTPVTQREFISNCKSIHGDKYDYSNTTYTKSANKISVTCNIHGEFTVRASAHSSGCGCPKCSSTACKSTTQFITEAKSRYGDKFDYSLVLYVGANRPVTIICPRHGEFKQIARVHLHSTGGCPMCWREQSNTEEFIQKAKTIHMDRYSYENAKYILACKKVVVHCKIHGDFEITPNNHLRGKGCPACNYSHGELLISKILLDNSISYLPQHTYPDLLGDTGIPLRFDFFLPHQNILIEYDGIQHYVHKVGMMSKQNYLKLQRYDAMKSKYCEDNNIPLIRIRYDEPIIEILSKICGLKN